MNFYNPAKRDRKLLKLVVLLMSTSVNGSIGAHDLQQFTISEEAADWHDIANGNHATTACTR